MKKILFFDTETTGLDPVKQDIIQLAGIIEIDGKIQEEFDLRMQPFSYENISQEALGVHGITLDEIKTYPVPHRTYLSFINLLEKYVDKYNREDKYYPAGYNVKFDLDFLSQFFIKNNDKYFGSWQNWHYIDPIPFLFAQELGGLINLSDYKLETVCKHFDIELSAHDALSDIKATRELINKKIIF